MHIIHDVCHVCMYVCMYVMYECIQFYSRRSGEPVLILRMIYLVLTGTGTGTSTGVYTSTSCTTTSSKYYCTATWYWAVPVVKFVDSFSVNR